MYFDKEESKKVTQVNFNNTKLIKITKTVAITLSAILILSGCFPDELKEKNNKDIISYEDSLLYQSHDEDIIYNQLCDYGNIMIRQDNGKFYSYKISNLFMISKDEDNLNDNYFLAFSSFFDKDIVNQSKAPKFKDPIVNIFKQTSIMHQIYEENKEKIKEEGKIFNIEISEEKLKELFKNWDGVIYSSTNNYGIKK